MAYPTLSELVQGVIREAGLTPGSSVQQYTEPVAVIAVNRAFDFIMRKGVWAHLAPWTVHTLNGTTGLITDSLAAVRDYTDIYDIRVGQAEERVMRAPDTAPTHINTTSGSRPMYWEPLPWDHADVATKLVRFYPLTATGTVSIRGLHRPAAFVADGDIVPFDRLVMQLGALWYLLASDALNARAAEKAQGLFDIAFQDLVSRLGKRDIGYGARWRDNLVIQS